MEIGVHRAVGVAALLTLAARLEELLRTGALTEQELAKPKRQSLLADATTADEQKARRQTSGQPGGSEAGAEGVMAVQGA